MIITCIRITGKIMQTFRIFDLIIWPISVALFPSIFVHLSSERASLLEAPFLLWAVKTTQSELPLSFASSRLMSLTTNGCDDDSKEYTQIFIGQYGCIIVKQCSNNSVHRDKGILKWWAYAYARYGGAHTQT